MLLSKYPRTFALIEPILRGKKILDLGCNCGYHLQSVGPGSLGLDYDAGMLDQAQSQTTQAFFARANFNSPYLPLAEESFNVVLASHVLEHVHGPIKYLGECNRVLMGGVSNTGLASGR